MNLNNKITGKQGIISNLKFILYHVWKWQPKFLLILCINIPVTALIPLIGIYFPKIMIDNLRNTSKGNHKIVYIIIIYTLLLILITLLAEWLQKCINSLKYYFQFRFHYMKTDKMMHTDYCNIDNVRGLDMEQQAGYGQECENILFDLSELFKSLFGILLYGGIIVSISPWILLTLLVTTFINYYMLQYSRRYNNSNIHNWIHLDRKLSYLDAISFDYKKAKDIKIYNMIGWFNELIRKYQYERLNWSKKINFRWTLVSVVDVICSFLRDGITYGILVYMTLSKRISVGDFVFFFGTVVGFASWLNSITNQINGINKKSINIGFLREYLNLKESYNHGIGIPLPKSNNSPPEIEFKNVSYKYEEAGCKVINNINFKIVSGEKIAIVGENGAGKSTLVKILCGLYFPTEGQVLVNGIASTKYNIDEYYTLFAPVFQDIFTIGISIERFITSSEGNGIIDTERILLSLHQAGLDKTIGKLDKGIKTILGKGVCKDSIELSGGETQKLMLARALYKDAPVIILDEPTASLDSIAEEELYMQYAELTKNKSSIYISHRLSSTRFCDRIIFLEDGQISEIGNHEELMNKNEKYAHMYKIQSSYYEEVGNDKHV